MTKPLSLTRRADCPLDNVANRAKGHAVLARKLHVRRTTFVVFSADRVEVIGTELPDDSTLHPAVGSVDCRWGGKQVSGIDASRVVTPMANKVAIGNRTKGQYIRKPVGAPILDSGFSPRFELTIAGWRATSYPDPARALACGFIDIAPEMIYCLINGSLPLPLSPIHAAIPARFLQTVRVSGDAIDLLVERIGRQITATVTATLRTKLIGHFIDLLRRSVGCHDPERSNAAGSFAASNYSKLEASHDHDA